MLEYSFLMIKAYIAGMFADDFVGVSDSRENLQKLTDVVYAWLL